MKKKIKPEKMDIMEMLFEPFEKPYKKFKKTLIKEGYTEAEADIKAMELLLCAFYSTKGENNNEWKIYSRHTYIIYSMWI